MAGDEIPISNFSDPNNVRRSTPSGIDGRQVTFAARGLSQERLDALREFLKHASADEIAQVRKLYGEMPEVLQYIGLEVIGKTKAP
jgi:hypothetical protein